MFSKNSSQQYFQILFYWEKDVYDLTKYGHIVVQKFKWLFYGFILLKFYFYIHI